MKLYFENTSVSRKVYLILPFVRIQLAHYKKVYVRYRVPGASHGIRAATTLKHDRTEHRVRWL